MSNFTLIAKYIKAGKPSFGTSEGYNYAVNIKGLDSNDFYTEPFGRSINDRKKAKEFAQSAKSGYADCKGKPSVPAVRKWIRENNPTEFYAMWKKDSNFYKDDSVEIYYKK